MRREIRESGGSCSIVTSGDGDHNPLGREHLHGRYDGRQRDADCDQPHSTLPAGGSLTVESGGTFVFNCGLGAAANPSATVQETSALAWLCLYRGSMYAQAVAFATHHIALLVGDWTNKNPAITALLAANHRDGVPLYLYYPPGAAAPLILPQTPSGQMPCKPWR